MLILALLLWHGALFAFVKIWRQNSYCPSQQCFSSFLYPGTGLSVKSANSPVKQGLVQMWDRGLLVVPQLPKDRVKSDCSAGLRRTGRHPKRKVEPGDRNLATGDI